MTSQQLEEDVIAERQQPHNPFLATETVESDDSMSIDLGVDEPDCHPMQPPASPVEVL